MSNSIDWSALTAPVEPDQVKWRVGRKMGNDEALVLAYVDARWHQRRLNRVVGHGNWDCFKRREGDAWLCRVVIRHEDGEAVREDAADESDVEKIKGGASDAFKRACVGFGMADELYGLGATYAKIDGKGRILKSEYPKLRGKVERMAMASDPVWDKRDGGGSGRESAPAEETAAAPNSGLMEWEFAIKGTECLDDLADIGRQIKESALTDDEKMTLRKDWLLRQKELME